LNRAVFRRAAEKALLEWHADQWDRQRDELDDLSHDLWVWYLERPETQRKLGELSEPEQVETARLAALQMLSRQVLSENTFQGKDLYSSDAIKEALKGTSSNKYLREALPYALAKVEARHPEYTEAIRCRYTDKVVPPQGSEHVRLSRAIKSVTEEVNVVYLTTNTEKIGSSSTVFPETRKRKGEHGDPTGNTAVMLDENPEFRHAFYEETPLHQFLGGRGATPEYDLGGGTKIRPTGYTAEVLRRYPQLVKPYLEKVRGELGLAG